jgi:hypothetical protein
MSENERKAREHTAENMDWQQVVLNGGPPCFHLEGERFCGRAQRWDGHIVTTDGPLNHKFISLAALLDSATERGVKALLVEHEYMNGLCLCGRFKMPSYGVEQLDEWRKEIGEQWTRDVRWHYWLEHVLEETRPLDSQAIVRGMEPKEKLAGEPEAPSDLSGGWGRRK